MAWLILILSGSFEAVWAVALDKSDGFRNPGPVLVFLLACAVSMTGLAYAMRSIPVGTAYAVWVGIGAAVTITWAMITGAEPYSLIKLALLIGLVGCVIGLKLVH